MIEFTNILKKASKVNASDVHLTVGIPPAMRVKGDIIHMDEAILTESDMEDLVFGLLSEAHKQKVVERGEVDFSYSIPEVGRFRVNVFRQRNTYALVARILNSFIFDPQALNLPQVVIDMAQKKRGLVLVTGPTGSGKSTTLASVVGVINKERNAHIITLEDPIEYLHHHDKAIVNQREIGIDSMTFADALRSSLRQDPDVILVGEMRDLETIATAVTAAETGHLVFSTLHTIGAANTVDRIIDVFPPHQQQQIRTQLADVLICVISQQLLPKKSGEGRVAAFEIMLNNPAIKNYIREAKTYQIASVIQTNRKAGMITMDDSLYDLFTKNIITQEDALGYSQDSVAMMRRL